MSTPESYDERPQVEPTISSAPRRPVSALAVLSIILGILALVAVAVNIGGVLAQIIGIVLAIFAIASGVIGMGQVLSGTKRGAGWAVIGIIIGFVALLLGILAAVFGIIIFSIRLAR